MQEPLAVAQSDAMYAKQHWWAEKWFGVVADNLLGSLPAREKARFALQRDQKGGPWLGVSPCRALGTEIPNEEFRLLCRYWLGAPLLETSGPLICPKCGNPSDGLGDHMVRCHKNDLRRETIHGALFELANLHGSRGRWDGS